MGIPRHQIRWNGWGWTAHQDNLSGRESFWRWLAHELGMPALLATPPRPLEELSLPAPRLGAARIAAFAAICGAERVHQDPYERAFHARGRSYQDLLSLRDGDLSTAPDAVIYPRGEEEVLALLKLAAAEKIAVIPFGGGTSGGVSGRPGAITLDMSGMDGLVAVDSVSGLAMAEAGIGGPALERALAAKDLALDQTPDFEFSTLGGWIAHPRAGFRADWLTGLRLATAQGMVEFAGRTGPDLKPLLFGSQGSLGIITQAGLRVRRMQPLLSQAFLLRDFAGGCAAIREAAQSGIAHRLLRLCDAEETYVMRAFAAPAKSPGLRARLEQLARPRPEAGAALLIASFSDTDSARRFAGLAKSFGARDLGEAPAKSWMADRFQLPYLRDSLLDHGVGLDTLEMAVSWSALPALYAAVKAALEKALRDTAPLAGAKGLVLAHIDPARGDGVRLAFHWLFPRKLDDEIAQAKAIRRAGLEAIAANGEAARMHQFNLAALKGLKTAFDPDGIMNPAIALV